MRRRWHTSSPKTLDPVFIAAVACIIILLRYLLPSFLAGRVLLFFVKRGRTHQTIMAGIMLSTSHAPCCGREFLLDRAA